MIFFYKNRKCKQKYSFSYCLKFIFNKIKQKYSRGRPWLVFRKFRFIYCEQSTRYYWLANKPYAYKTFVWWMVTRLLCHNLADVDGFGKTSEKNTTSGYENSKQKRVLIAHWARTHLVGQWKHAFSFYISKLLNGQ